MHIAVFVNALVPLAAGLAFCYGESTNLTWLDGLIKDIKGYHIRVCSSSYSSIEKVMKVVYFPPLLLLVDYPI
jgi:hypothetical protein